MVVKLKLKKGDRVIVIAGKDKGKSGEITKVIPSTRRVFVSGVNMIVKHQKPSQAGAGGKVKQEASLHISNIALADPKDGKPTRIKYEIQEGKEKIRIAVRSGEKVNG